MQLPDPDLQSMVEMELSTLSIYTICTNPRFLKLICSDARIPSRYPFFYTSARDKDNERMKRTILSKVGMQNGFQAFLFVFAYPGESCRFNENILSLVQDGITVIDATQIALEQELCEEYALNIACSNRFVAERDPAAIAYMDKAYESLRSWTDSIVSSAVRVYDSENPDGVICPQLQDFYDRTISDIERIYPYSPDTMGLDDFFFQSVGARHYVREGYYGKQEDIKEIRMGKINPNRIVQKVEDPQRTPEILFDYAWGNDNAWDDPEYSGEKIVILKKAFDGYVEEQLSKGEPISFKEIFEFMRKPPYGLLPNVIGAILMGMFFRTWRNRNLIWTNGFQQDILDDSHLLSMVENGIHNQRTYHRNSLVDSIMSPTSKTVRLTEALASIFDLDRVQYLFLPELRSSTRIALEKLPYPIVSMRYAELGDTDQAFIEDLIGFVRLASDEGNNEAEDALIRYLDKAYEEGDDLPQRIKGTLYGDRLRQGFAGMLSRFGVEPDTVTEENLKGICVGHCDWKWLWQEESVIREINSDGRNRTV